MFDDTKVVFFIIKTGKPVPEGLYVYQIKFSYTDQKGINRNKNHKGQVSLIR